MFAFVIQSLYITSNPIPTKFTLAKKGIIETGDVRLPLVPMTEKDSNALLLAFKDFPELL